MHSQFKRKVKNIFKETIILFKYILNISRQLFRKDRRFLVIDPIQFILVEPEVKRIGWGIVKFSDLIQVQFFFYILKINLNLSSN